MKTHDCYHVQVAFISYKGEESLTIVFNAEDDAQAIVDGVRWAQNRLASMQELCDSCKELAAIKVHRYQIGSADEDGYIRTGIFNGNFVPILEWKCDHPATIEETVEYCKKTVTP